MDEEWYEAAIATINPHTARCIVRYLGYNNEEELPLGALQRSKGETARRRQLEAAACDALSEVRQRWLCGVCQGMFSQAPFSDARAWNVIKMLPGMRARVLLKGISIFSMSNSPADHIK